MDGGGREARTVLEKLHASRDGSRAARVSELLLTGRGNEVVGGSWEHCSLGGEHCRLQGAGFPFVSGR